MKPTKLILLASSLAFLFVSETHAKKTRQCYFPYVLRSKGAGPVRTVQ